MREDLTYRQQRKLSLIAESVIAGQEIEETAQTNINEERIVELVEELNELLSDDSIELDEGFHDKLFGRGTPIGNLLRTPRRLGAKAIREIDDLFGDNLDKPTERRLSALGTGFLFGQLFGGGGGGGGGVLPGGGGGVGPAP